MYEDRTLLPQEAIKLLALGLLRADSYQYAKLASEIRQFVAKIVGPSLDLLGSSLEILKLEGLVTIEDQSEATKNDQRRVTITQNGILRFEMLMNASLRVPMDDINRLVLLTKLRFLTYLPNEQQLDQLDLYLELVHKEQALLNNLITEHSEGVLGEWLTMEQQTLKTREQLIQTWLNETID